MRADHLSQRLRWLAVVLCLITLPWGANTQPPASERPKLTAPELGARLEKAGRDPVALLKLLPLVEVREAARLRQTVNGLLAERKQIASREEREVLGRAVARLLPTAARFPAEVRELLGTPQQVLRQVLYRRYVEQWHYDTPLALCVVLQGIKGQVPRVQTVLVAGTGNP